MSKQSQPIRDRQALTERTFVELVETLVDDFDVVDLLTVLASRSLELLGADAAGILLVDESGGLRVIGASSEEVGLLELFQVQNEQGPCFDSFHTGQVVVEADLGATSRWPLFAAESVSAGYASVCAVPLRLRGETLGCLNLFMSRPVLLAAEDVGLAQALADVATIAIFQDHVGRASTARELRLTNAVEGRIALEQAKGITAEHCHVDIDEAFWHLRAYARSRKQGISAVATAIVAGTLTVDQLIAKRPD